MLVFRADTLKGLLATILWGIFSFVAIYVLSANSKFVYGWSRQELFLLTGVNNIIVHGLFRTIADWNFEKMPYVIQHGELDSYLVKPIDSQFLISFLYIRLYGVVRIAISFILTIFILHQANISITYLTSLSFFVLLIFALIILYSMWYIIMTFLIWFPDLYNLPYVAYSADNLARYPQEVLWAIGIPVFYIFFPFTLVGSIPAKALLHKLSLQEALILIIVSCALLYTSRKFWKFALRYYTSASG